MLGAAEQEQMKIVVFALKELKRGQLEKQNQQKGLSLSEAMLGVPSRDGRTSLGTWDGVGSEGDMGGLQTGVFLGEVSHLICPMLEAQQTHDLSGVTI